MGGGSFVGRGLWAMGTTMKGAQQFVQPHNITPSVVCQRSVASRAWEALVPSAGVASSKEGCGEPGEQLVRACSPLLGVGLRDGGQDWAGLAQRMFWSV